MARLRHDNHLTEAEKVEKRRALLAALEKATRDEAAVNGGRSDGDSYYVFTQEEKDALVRGDMATIETWISNLDREHATRLLRWLIKEGW